MLLTEGGGVHHFEYDLDHQAAAGADGDFFAVAEVGERDFELVAAGAGVGVEGGGLVVGHVFDLDLVVEGHRCWSLLHPKV